MAGGDDLRQELLSVWEAHRDAGWPKGSGANEGELMTLDTVISGCMVYFLDSQGTLDPQRADILQGCIEDLDLLLPELAEESCEYFSRLRILATLLLDSTKRL